ncbi:MAG TPA: hypothetical protein DEF51_29405, partial [Myxococcales bacterium]|nr:hypothetical protein [Myxococcales bacterium]
MSMSTACSHVPALQLNWQSSKHAEQCSRVPRSTLPTSTAPSQSSSTPLQVSATSGLCAAPSEGSSLQSRASATYPVGAAQASTGAGQVVALGSQPKPSPSASRWKVISTPSSVVPSQS